MPRSSSAALLALLTVTILVRPADAQDVEATSGQAVVVATGQGEITLRPDRATVSITVRTVANDAAEASARNETAASSVSAAVSALRLEPDSLRSTGVRVGPNREYGPDGPRDAGYFAERSMRVTTNDMGAVGRIVAAAVGAGATQIDHVAYTSSEEEGARRAALIQAVQKARADAEVVAAAAGGRLGGVVLLSTQGVSVPRPMYRMEAMAAAAPAADASIPDPEDIVVTAHIQGHWAYAGDDR